MHKQGLVQFLEGRAVFSGFDLGEDLLAGMRIKAVIHDEFDQFGQVRLTLKGDIGALALDAGAHAAEDNRQGAGLVQGDAAGGETHQ